MENEFEIVDVPAAAAGNVWKRAIAALVTAGDGKAIRFKIPGSRKSICSSIFTNARAAALKRKVGYRIDGDYVTIFLREVK